MYYTFIQIFLQVFFIILLYFTLYLFYIYLRLLMMCYIIKIIIHEVISLVTLDMKQQHLTQKSVRTMR